MTTPRTAPVAPGTSDRTTTGRPAGGGGPAGPAPSSGDVDPAGAAPSSGSARRTRRTRRARRAGERTISWRVRLRRDRSLILMTLPAVLLLAVFAYVPMAGNVIAWQNYSPYTGFLHSPFVGWSNFERVFTNPAFLNAVGNTLTITVFQLLFYFPVPIVLALLLNSVMSPRIRTIVQSIVYLPHFFSWVLVVTIFQQLFGGAGLVNQVLSEHGGGGFDLMTNPHTFLVLITSQSIWKDAGWGIIIFLAALTTVSPELYEASVVDGAGRWRRMWHVTLPALRPVIILLLILRLGDALTVGFEQLILQRDAVGSDVSEVIDTYVYYQGVIYGDWSFAAAAGLVKGIVSLALVLGANKLAHVFGESGVYKRS
ncbi:ABC transporter permease [Luteimicrobium sp. DT211]|uniref:ABC transporter permease n=1 Tax=Luteimicrobium sp. DT211 TaxID=3393412 RepID=UPI003CE97D66